MEGPTFRLIVGIDKYRKEKSSFGPTKQFAETLSAKQKIIISRQTEQGSSFPTIYEEST